MEIEWKISALHAIAKDVDARMLDFAKFLGGCPTLPWNMYGVHIYEQDGNLMFMG